MVSPQSLKVSRGLLLARGRLLGSVFAHALVDRSPDCYFRYFGGTEQKPDGCEGRIQLQAPLSGN